MASEGSGSETIGSDGEGVAGRYASALFDLARDQGVLDAVAIDLRSVQAMLRDSVDFRQLVRSPVFSTAEQVRGLGAILKAGGASALTSNFLGLVAKNRRLFAAPDMIKSYLAMVARHRGEVAADVVTAAPLTQQQMDTLKTALKAATGKDVQINAQVDPAILGGLVFKIGSRMIDTSLATKLNNLKARMKEVG